MYIYEINNYFSSLLSHDASFFFFFFSRFMPEQITNLTTEISQSDSLTTSRTPDVSCSQSQCFFFQIIYSQCMCTLIFFSIHIHATNSFNRVIFSTCTVISNPSRSRPFFFFFFIPPINHHAMPTPPQFIYYVIT